MHRRSSPTIIAAFLLFVFLRGPLGFALDREREKLLQPVPETPAASLRCYEFILPDNSKIDALVAQVPKDIKKSYFFINVSAFKGSKNFWFNTFSCYPDAGRYHSSSGENYLCVGDDDGGRFYMKGLTETAELKISFIHFGNPDEEGPDLTAKKRFQYIKLKGTTVSCGDKTGETSRSSPLKSDKAAR